MPYLPGIRSTSIISKERIVWILSIVLAGTVGYYTGEKATQPEHKAQVAVEVVSENTDVADDIDKSFGWSRAPAGTIVEVVDAVKGMKRGGDDYPFSMPAVKLAIKNVGDSDLKSFGINVLVLDNFNQRKIASYGQASGFIKQGWVSDKKLFVASESDWNDVAGRNKIDFPVTMVVTASIDGGDKEIFRADFDPFEIDGLRELNY